MVLTSNVILQILASPEVQKEIPALSGLYAEYQALPRQRGNCSRPCGDRPPAPSSKTVQAVVHRAKTVIQNLEASALAPILKHLGVSVLYTWVTVDGCQSLKRLGT